MRSLALVLLCLTCTGSLAAADHDVCGKISPSRVSDIQWSGSPSATTEHVSYSGAPYNPTTGRHASVEAGDYYTLSTASGTNYQLKQYSGNGVLKSTFPEGTAKANAEAVFVIIDGWYGTVITQTDHSTYGSDTFTNLQTDPTSTFVQGACLASQELSATPTDLFPTCFAAALAALLVSACAVSALVVRKTYQLDISQPLLVSV